VADDQAHLPGILISHQTKPMIQCTW